MVLPCSGGAVAGGAELPCFGDWEKQFDWDVGSEEIFDPCGRCCRMA